jgi:hypothetical protein
MFFNFARRRGFEVCARQSLFLFFVVFFTLQFSAAPFATNAQTVMTRQQFSRLSVLARASVFEREILKAAETEGVDPNVLWTIAYNETRFRPWLTSPKNARGMMQFIPSTAARFDLADPYQPIPAIRAAAKYVKYLSGLFAGRVDSILAAYNSGEGTVSAYLYGKTLRDGRKIINAGGQKTIGGVPPYSETVGYVGRGLKIYRWLIARQTFANASYKANFPNVISASVARVSLYDPELGSVPNFIIPTVIQENSSRITVAQNQTTSAPSEQQKNEPKTQEIFYDPRSGNRYILGENGKIKLPDDGAVVVSVDTRRPANIARSLFFATPLNK